MAICVGKSCTSSTSPTPPKDSLKTVQDRARGRRFPPRPSPFIDDSVTDAAPPFKPSMALNSWSPPCPSSTSSTMSAHTPRTPSTSASCSGLLAFASSRIGSRSGVVRYDKFFCSFSQVRDDDVSKVTLPLGSGEVMDATGYLKDS
nr:uncharacterized protein LOC127294425 isoform X1 [Lolium perenne]XP_051180197.1 uncharacterized protein LOC127294425 isoform X2 [Lolium perenne]